MRSIALAIIFIGTILFLNGVYMDRSVQPGEEKTKVIFVPRTYYDEQLNSVANINTFKSLWE